MIRVLSIREKINYTCHMRTTSNSSHASFTCAVPRFNTIKCMSLHLTYTLYFFDPICLDCIIEYFYFEFEFQNFFFCFLRAFTLQLIQMRSPDFIPSFRLFNFDINSIYETTLQLGTLSNLFSQTAQ